MAGYAVPESIVADTGDAYIPLSPYGRWGLPHEALSLLESGNLRVYTVMFRLDSDASVGIPTAQNKRRKAQKWLTVHGGSYLMASPALESSGEPWCHCNPRNGGRRWGWSLYSPSRDIKYGSRKEANV